MADIKDKEYSRLREDLELLGKGAEKHKADKEHPLPPNITKARFAKVELELEEAFTEAQDAQTALKNAMDKYHTKFKECDDLKNKDQRLIKGVFGIYNPDLRDFGIAPEKKKTGRTHKP